MSLDMKILRKSYMSMIDEQVNTLRRIRALHLRMVIQIDNELRTLIAQKIDGACMEREFQRLVADLRAKGAIVE